MPPFSGFPEGKVRLTPLPGPFFSELLPAIDHLGELKLTLQAFWLVDHLETAFRYLRREDFQTNPDFMRGFGATDEQADRALEDALQRAVQRGTLLRVVVRPGEDDLAIYFINTPKGRAAVQAFERGEWTPTGEVNQPVEILPEAPNVYQLYEKNIGPLTPMIAEALRDAEQSYPAAWIADAIKISVENNKRSLRYIEAILRSWQEKGRDERKNRRDTEKARRRYADWETD
jgi:DNA replication protein